MKYSFSILTLAALASAAPVQAEPQTRTQTFTGPNVTSERTTTIDREAGTFDRSRETTHLNSGKTKSRNVSRTRTETGRTIEGSRTTFNGKTRTLSGERTRTENGSTFSGTTTGAAGRTHQLQGTRSRNNGEFNASQTVTNANGRVVRQRDVTASRSNGQRSRTVSVQGRRPRR